MLSKARIHYLLGTVLVASGCVGTATAGAQVPQPVLGRWRIVRVLPTGNVACWNQRQADALLGSTLEYRPASMVWKGGEVPLIGQLAVTRSLTADHFLQEYRVSFANVGIRTPRVTEVVLQHEDADVTGGSTEIPGDTVELAGPGRIVVSACGVYFEAVRARR